MNDETPPTAALNLTTPEPGSGAYADVRPLPADVPLWNIDLDLAQLMEYRDERADDPKEPATAEELAAIDGEISRYLEALPRKVSGVVAMVRKWEAVRENAKAEQRRYAAIVGQMDGNVKRIKAYVKPILERLPEPKKGSRSLTGADGSRLILKGNGGLQPLQVDGWDAEAERWTHESVLPESLRLLTVKMPADFFAQYVPGDASVKVIATEPDNAYIRSQLAEPCRKCDGSGKIQRAKFITDPITGESIDVRQMGDPCDPCKECDGTGKTIVPGARLLPRASHVEVK